MNTRILELAKEAGLILSYQRINENRTIEKMFCISEKSLERFSLLMQAEALDEAAEIIPHHRALTRMAKQKRKEAE